MKPHYLLFILLWLKVTLNFSQQKWYTKFGWWGVDIGYDVVQTMDGHYMITGYTGTYTFGNSDVLIAKVHQLGWLMWAKYTGGTNNDIGKALVATLDSGFVIAGYTNSFGNGGYDGYLIKVNKMGDTVWTKTYGGIDWDVFNAIQLTSDLGFVMVGYSYTNSKGKKDMWIVKTDSIGNLQWERKIGGIEDDEFVSVEILQNGRIACFGTTYSFSDTKGNYCIFKTNNNGDSLFFKDFGYSNLEDIGYDFTERLNDNMILIAGTSQTPFGTDTTYYHQLVVDSLCNWIVDKKETIGQLKNQIVYTNAYMNLNKHYVVYGLWGLGQGKNEPGFYVFADQWYITGTTYGSSENEIIFSCKRTNDQGLIAVGYTTGFFSLQEDVFVVKLDSNILSATNVVGIEEIEKEISFNIYPNIATDKIFIRMNHSYPNAEVYIQDMQGRWLIQQKVNLGSEAIDVSELEDGMYVVTVIIDNKKYSKKLIKKSYKGG